ncbi:MAG: DUF3575 domain-containing protein [Alistipes communis]
MEYSFGDCYSVDLPVIYSPYTVARDYRLCFLAVQSGIPLLAEKPMEGHFFGVHLHIGASISPWTTGNRYQSPDGFTVRLSYGYMLLPSLRHWAAEFLSERDTSVLKYDVYYNIPNGARFGEGSTLQLLGPDQSGDQSGLPIGK